MMKNSARPASNHSGRRGNPCACALRRRDTVFQAISAASARPSAQLQVGPSEPSRPPPNIRNSGSLTGWVLPSAIRKAAPRNDIRPPSVTTNEGTPRYATSEPWYSAITSDTASPARQAGAQCQPLAVHQEGDQYADDAQHRTDRQVDLARDDDQRDGRGNDADHGRLLRDVVEVLRRQEVARERVEDERHHDQHACHDGQAQVESADLQSIQHASGSRSSAVEGTPPRRERRDDWALRRRAYLQAAGAVAGATPLQAASLVM